MTLSCNSTIDPYNIQHLYPLVPVILYSYYVTKYNLKNLDSGRIFFLKCIGVFIFSYFLISALQCIPHFKNI